MELTYDARYPSVDDLRTRAKKRIPRFAFEYLDGGCNEDVNLHRNTSDIREIELVPQYLTEHRGSDMKTELFGHTYDAPVRNCAGGTARTDLARFIQDPRQGRV